MLKGWIAPVNGPSRSLTGGYATVYTLTAAAFSLWYLYTSGFGLVSTETNRGLYLMFTSVLVFLLYPDVSTGGRISSVTRHGLMMRRFLGMIDQVP